MAADVHGTGSPSFKSKEVPGTDTCSRVHALLSEYLPTLGKVSDVVMILDRFQNLAELPRRSRKLVKNVDRFLLQVNYCHRVMETKPTSSWNRAWTELSKNYINTFLSDEYGPLPAEILPSSVSKCPIGDCPTDPDKARQTLTSLATTFRTKAATHMLCDRWLIDGVKLLVYFAQVAQGWNQLCELKIDVEDMFSDLEHCRREYCLPVLRAMQTRFQLESTSPEDSLDSFALLITKGLGHLECLQRRIVKIQGRSVQTRNQGGILFVSAMLEFVASSLQLKELWPSATVRAKLMSLGKTCVQGACAGVSGYITYVSHVEVERLKEAAADIDALHADLVAATSTLRKYAKRTGALPEDPRMSPLPSCAAMSGPEHFYGLDHG